MEEDVGRRQEHWADLLPLSRRLAREYRLKCIYRRDFDDLLEEELEDRESRALAVRMNVISREGDLFMDEGQFEVCSECQMPQCVAFVD